MLAGSTNTDIDYKLILPEGGLRGEHMYQLVDLIPKRIKKRKISVGEGKMEPGEGLLDLATCIYTKSHICHQ